MKMIYKITLLLLFIFIVLLFSTYLYCDISNDFGSIITFLSIVSGFTITSLSIIATSNFSTNLYKIEDPTDNSKTLLHTLVNKIIVSISTTTLIIFLILLYPFLKKADYTIAFYKTEISIIRFLGSMIWILTVFSLVYYLKLINVFAKFVIQGAKKQS